MPRFTAYATFTPTFTRRRNFEGDARDRSSAIATIGNDPNPQTDPMPQTAEPGRSRGAGSAKRSFLAVGMRIVESAQPHAQPPGAPEAISNTTPLT
jgi:hypothetical protein